MASAAPDRGICAAAELVNSPTRAEIGADAGCFAARRVKAATSGGKPVLSGLLLNGAARPSSLTLTQTRLRQPVTVSFRLSGRDQHQAPMALRAIDVAVESARGASTTVTLSVGAPTSTATLLITPREDIDDVVTARFESGGFAISVVIHVDAVDRVLDHLRITAPARVEQSAFGAVTKVAFSLTALDNYGDVWRRPTPLMLEAFFGGGATPVLPEKFTLPVGGGGVEVLVTPVGVAATLTFVARAAGVEAASARTWIEVGATNFIVSFAQSEMRVSEADGKIRICAGLATDAVATAAPAAIRATLDAEASSTARANEDYMLARPYARLALGETLSGVCADLRLNDDDRAENPETLRLRIGSVAYEDAAGPLPPLLASTRTLLVRIDDDDRIFVRFESTTTALVERPLGASVAAAGFIRVSLWDDRNANPYYDNLGAQRAIRLSLADVDATVEGALGLCPDDLQALVAAAHDACLRAPAAADWHLEFDDNGRFLHLIYERDGDHAFRLEIVAVDDGVAEPMERFSVSMLRRPVVDNTYASVGNTRRTLEFTLKDAPVASRLILRAATETLTQRAPGEAVTALFSLRVVDAEGLALPYAVTVSLSAQATGGATPTLPNEVAVGAGGAEVAVSLTPDAADATLTLVARLAGAGETSARVSVAAAATARLGVFDADGVETSVLMVAESGAATFTLRILDAISGAALRTNQALELRLTLSDVAAASFSGPTRRSVDLSIAAGTSSATFTLVAAADSAPASATLSLQALSAPAAIETPSRLSVSVFEAPDSACAHRLLLAETADGEGAASLSLSLRQEYRRQTLTRRLYLTALDRDGAPLAPMSRDLIVEVTATAGASARFEMSPLSGGVAQALPLTLTITPLADADTTATLRVSLGALVAEAIIGVDALDRSWYHITVSAPATATQAALYEEVSVPFAITLVDNYGDFDRLPPIALGLEALSRYGNPLVYPARVQSAPGGATALVSLIPRPGEDDVIRLSAASIDQPGLKGSSLLVAVAAAGERPRLSGLLLDGATRPGTLTLTQTRPRRPVEAAFQLSGLDQYGRSVALDALSVAGESAGDALVETTVTLSYDTAISTATLIITPHEDNDDVVTARFESGGFEIGVVILIDAVDRALASLRVTAPARVEQSAFGADASVRFSLSGIDNYGDVWRRPTPLTLQASFDGRPPTLPEDFVLPAGGGELTISVTPADVAATLTLTARAADGEVQASAMTRILPAEDEAILSVLHMDALGRIPGAASIDAGSAAPGQPAVVTFTLTASDQFGAPIALGAVRLDLSPVVGGAQVSLHRMPSADGFSEIIEVVIELDGGAAARFNLEAIAANGVLVRRLIRAFSGSSPVLTRLLIDGSEVASLRYLRQSAIGEPVVATFTLTAEDQYGQPIAIPRGSDPVYLLYRTRTSVPWVDLPDMRSLRRSADDTAIEVSVAFGLPEEFGDRDGLTRVDFRLSDESVQAIIFYVMEAVPRTPVTLHVMPTRDEWPQPGQGAVVTATFEIGARDNYGDFNKLTTTLTFTVSSSGGDYATAPADLRLSGDGSSATVAVRVAPPDAGTTLTLVARDAGGVRASAMTRILPAEDEVRLSVLHMDALGRIPGAASIDAGSAAPGQPAVVTFTLTASDQFGAPIALGAVGLDLSPVGGGVQVNLRRMPSADGFSEIIEVVIELNGAAEARFELEATAANGVLVRRSIQAFSGPPPALTRLLIDGSEVASLRYLRQSAIGEPVVATFTLTAEDQYGQPIAIPRGSDPVYLLYRTQTSAPWVDLPDMRSFQRSADDTAIEVSVAFGLPEAFENQEIPDGLTRVDFRLSDESAQVIIFYILAVAPRTPVEFQVASTREEWTQAERGAVVTATFEIGVRDNYGGLNKLTTTLTFTVSSSAGGEVVAPADLRLSGDGAPASVAVRIAPPDTDTTLTLVVRDAGGDLQVSATTRILPVEPLVLSALRMDALGHPPGATSLEVDQAAPRQPAVVTFTLTASDQFGAPIALGAVGLDVSPIVGGARVDLRRMLSADGFSETIEVVIEFNTDAEARFDVEATAANGVLARRSIRARPVSPSALRRLLIDGEEESRRVLRQSAIGEPVVASLRVRATDQRGAPFAVPVVAIDATATAGATLAPLPATATLTEAGLTLELRVTPNMDADAMVRLRVSAGEVSATLQVEVDAVDRAPANLELTAAVDSLTQSAFGERLGVEFELRLTDNYGDVSPPTMVSLRASAGGGARVSAPSTVLAPGTVTVYVTARGANTNLTLTASLDHLTASDSVRVTAVAPRVLSAVELSQKGEVRRPPGGEVEVIYTVTLRDDQGDLWLESTTISPRVLLISGNMVDTPASVTVVGGMADVSVRFTLADDATTDILRVQVLRRGQVPASRRPLIVNIPAVAAARLAGLSLTPSTRSLSVAQTSLRAPVEVTLTLVARDQHGAAFSIAGVMSEIAIGDGAGEARILATTVADDGLSAEVAVRITPHEDSDVVATYRAFIGEVEVAAMIAVDAIDREPARLEAIPEATTLTQNAAGIVTATLFFRITDNYGDDDRLRPDQRRLQVRSSGAGLSRIGEETTTIEVADGGGSASFAWRASSRFEELELSLLMDLPGVEQRMVGLRVVPARVRLTLDDVHAGGDTVFESLARSESSARVTIRRRTPISREERIDLRILARDQNGQLFDAKTILCVDPEAAECMRREDAVPLSWSPDVAGTVLARLSLSESDTSAIFVQLTLTPEAGVDLEVDVLIGGDDTRLSVSALVDVVERAAASLSLRAGDGATRLRQQVSGERISQAFIVDVVDNYGDGDRLDALRHRVRIQVESSDGLPIELSPATLPARGDQNFNVHLTPVRDSTLTVRVAIDDLARVLHLPIKAAPATLAGLLLNDATTATLFLDQQGLSGLRRPVVASLRLRAVDSRRMPLAVPVVVAIDATATAGATLAPLPATATLTAAGLTLALSVTPKEDADTRVRLRVSSGEIAATALVEVDAVDRQVARLELTTAMDSLAQSAFGERLGVDFALRLVDNYGDDDVLPPMEVRLQASADGAAVAEAPPTILAPGVVTVHVTPQGEDTELTLEARLGRLLGVESVRVDAVTGRRLTLDGETSVKVDEEGLASFVVSLGVLDAAGMMVALDGGEVRLSASAEGGIEIIDAAVIAAAAATDTLAVALSTTRVFSAQMSVDVMVTVRWRGAVAAELILRAARAGSGDAELRVRILPGRAAFDVDGNGVVEFIDLALVLRYLLLDAEARLALPITELTRNLRVAADAATLRRRLALFADPANHGLLDFDGDGEENAYDGRLLARYLMFGRTFTDYDRRAGERIRILLGL